MAKKESTFLSMVATLFVVTLVAAGLLGSAYALTKEPIRLAELKKKNEELNRFNRLAVGRERKMIELKKEVNALLWKLGEKPEYEIAGES